MPVFICPACQNTLSIKEDLAGNQIKCPACGNEIPAPLSATIAWPTQDSPEPPNESSAKTEADDQGTTPSLSDVTKSQAPGEAEYDAKLTDFLAPPQADDELGRLGGYRILKILGHGGMGVVFLSEDPKLGRQVAIKAMLPHLAGSKSLQQRFLREARAAAALEHDHIVHIHHVGEDRGAPFIVMPFLKGESLNYRLQRESTLPLAEVLRIGREIAAGLAAAHDQGLIHRDIKPANVWLEALRQRVKILDFGLARASAQESGLTQEGTIVGTPAYMAPEQARGEMVDARTDLFSLGCILYRMCTGQPPFRAKDSVSTLLAVAEATPPPPCAVDKALPRDVSDFILKLLAKKPADRPLSAHEVAARVRT